MITKATAENNLLQLMLIIPDVHLPSGGRSVSLTSVSSRACDHRGRKVDACGLCNLSLKLQAMKHVYRGDPSLALLTRFCKLVLRCLCHLLYSEGISNSLQAGAPRSDPLLD